MPSLYLPHFISYRMRQSDFCDSRYEYHFFGSKKQLGVNVASEVEKGNQIVTDPALNQRIKSMGARLAAGLPRRDYNYSLVCQRRIFSPLRPGR